VTGILDDLDARGLIHDTTDRAALAGRLADGPVTLYYGCDPTAPSLHVGNLIGLLILRRFQDAGHRPIALAGGATGMIGDPSGRSEERNLLDEATLAANVAAISAQMARILDVEGTSGATLVDNRDWTAELTLIEFLRDVGRHVTVNQMVARESVRARMEGEQGISFTEFTYMLLQAHDYLWLHDHESVELQIGGSDQWGNILSGVDLVRRTRQRAVHGLCWPLLTAADGTKLGKTTGARTWLDPEPDQPLRLLPALDDHRGRRRPPDAGPVHPPARRRGRRRRRRPRRGPAAPRGPAPAGPGGDHPGPRPRRGPSRRGGIGHPLRGVAHGCVGGGPRVGRRRGAGGGAGPGRGPRRRVSTWWPCWCGPGSPPPTARLAATSTRGACRSTAPGSPPATGSAPATSSTGAGPCCGGASGAGPCSMAPPADEV
jgi:hypothetical protein